MRHPPAVTTVVSAIALSIACLAGITSAQSTPSQPVFLEPGYTTNIFYQDPTSSNPTSLARDAQGRIYVGYISGQIRVLEDIDGDLVSDLMTVFWPGTGITFPLTGILWHQGSLYVSHQGTISRIDDQDGDLVGDVKTDIVTGLPVGLHQNNGLFTDGQWLYFGLGSQTDHAVDPDPRSGTIMRMAFDGTQLSIYASGLRNVYDGVFHPETGDIIAGDNGPNMVPGLPNPPDEINVIRPARDYGHPSQWGTTTYAAGFTPPAAELITHTSPTGLALNPCLAISGYRNSIMLTAFGGGPAGALVRIRPVYGTWSSDPIVEWLPFVLGLASPIDVVFTRTGEILVAEFTTKTLRIIRQDFPAVVTVEGQPSVGMSCPISFFAPSFPKHNVFAIVSTSLGTPTPLGNNTFLWVDPLTALTTFSLTQGNGVFDLPWPGSLDSQGRATGSMVLPPSRALVGVTIYLQCVIQHRFTMAFLAASPPLAITVLPQF